MITETTDIDYYEVRCPDEAGAHGSYPTCGSLLEGVRLDIESDSIVVCSKCRTVWHVNVDVSGTLSLLKKNKGDKMPFKTRWRYVSEDR